MGKAKCRDWLGVERRRRSRIDRAGTDPPHVWRAFTGPAGRCFSEGAAAGLMTKSRALHGDFAWRRAVSAPEHAG